MTHEPFLRCEHCGAIVDPRTEFHACARCGCNPATGARETIPADAAMATAIAGIAKHCLGFPTLDERKIDRLDFREVHVNSVRQALEGAFRAGAAAASNMPTQPDVPSAIG